MRVASILTCAGFWLAACAPAPEPATAGAPAPAQPSGTFGEDLEFLRQHQQIIVLSDAAGQARVAVAPAYQGRVMTSTARGDEGRSFGWVNYDLIRGGEVQEHINAFGGEDRIWLGPEGGQFSIFFAEGADFDVASWHTPKALDTEPFEVVATSPTQASFRKPMQLTNHSGASFQLELGREVELLDAGRVAELIGLQPAPGVSSVAYESRNTLTNTGPDAWRKESGLLSIWILGMFRPTADAVVAVPFDPADEADPASIVTTDYFGAVPPERLVVRDGVAYFKADGQHRSKIGIPRPYAKPVLGSYAPGSGVLTIVQYHLPEDATDYVDSRWKIHDEPYAGDVANSYNDGPMDDGSMLGPFYELETSSPAAALDPGESLTHVHRTFHFVGSPEDLDAISLAVFGVSVGTIAAALS